MQQMPEKYTCIRFIFEVSAAHCRNINTSVNIARKPQLEDKVTAWKCLTTSG